MHTRIKVLLFGILIITYPLNAQSDTNCIANSFYNFWLSSEYYNGIIQGETPFELAPMKIAPIQIFFPKDSNVIFWGSLQEGITGKFNIIDSLSIEFTLYNSEKARLIKAADNKLSLIFQHDTMSFVSLPSKYYMKEGLTSFINDNFVTGTYSPESSDKIIEFAQNGDLHGIDKFNHFSISLWGIGTPEFDTIILSNSDTGYYRRYCWKRDGDILLLYELDLLNQDNPTPDELSKCRTGKLFCKLKRNK